MKIVIAPNAFKQSLSSFEVANALKQGFEKVYAQAEYTLIPIADGGEGTSKILTLCNGGISIEKEVLFANNVRKIATYGLSKDKKTAFIECAETAGIIHQKQEDLDPLHMTTYGTGELILDALDHAVETIVLGVGGTCTNDGGMGILSALGVKFYDADNAELIGNGENLVKIARIDISQLDARLKTTQCIIASDVTNVLCGPEGSAFIYAPQKGASKDLVNFLDKGLYHFGLKIYEATNNNVFAIPGGGSGGGIGAGLYGILKAKIISGFELICSYTGLEKIIQQADLVLSGEGKIDYQTKLGKGPHQVAKLAKQYEKKVIGFSGLKDNTEFQEFDAIFSLKEANTPPSKYDLEHAYDLLVSLATNAAKTLKEQEV